MELREGSQYCQNHTPEFLRQTLGLSHKLTDRQLLIRMDSGNDSAENMGILIEDGSWFIVKRNMYRGETKQDWLDKVRECCRDITLMVNADSITVRTRLTWMSKGGHQAGSKPKE